MCSSFERISCMLQYGEGKKKKKVFPKEKKRDEYTWRVHKYIPSFRSRYFKQQMRITSIEI